MNNNLKKAIASNKKLINNNKNDEINQKLKKLFEYQLKKQNIYYDPFKIELENLLAYQAKIKKEEELKNLEYEKKYRWWKFWMWRVNIFD